MSVVTKLLLATVALVALAVLVRGDQALPAGRQAPPVRYPVPQAPPVKPVCLCTSPLDCACGAGACQCERCDIARHTDYAAARAAAIATGRPLLVWVGWVCPPCTVKVGDQADSVFVSAGHFSGLIARGVIVCLPRGGELYHHAQLPPGVTGDQILAAIAAARNPPVRQAYYQPQPPQFFPPQMGFGGFGGGMQMGCAGGG